MARRFKTKAWRVNSILELLNKHKSAKVVAEIKGVSEFTMWAFMRKHSIKRKNCYVVEVDAGARSTAQSKS